MRNLFSLACTIAICIVLLFVRSSYLGSREGGNPFTVTQWDAFGYYLYAPAVLLYDDHKKLDWAAEVDRKYNVSGGGAMPVIALENGNKVDKYFCGVALLQTPLMLAGHMFAKTTGTYPADGFSLPYQYALAYGVILYCLLSLFLLRRILLRYFKDLAVGIALLLLCLATNFVQYAGVDNGLSHAYIFPLYVLVLYATILWHERPTAFSALAIGYLVGLGMICRPTELIMFFIPLLWATHNREHARAKWRMVREHRTHIFFALAGGLLGILPQLLYWKSVTGDFIYDVGSKWVFLNPWFRVLVGWEKGWFIYTPATLLFVIGLFFIKRYEFRYSVLVFCLLNIWIVIAWDEWQYGASYAGRAMMQSYPVFALPLAAVTTKILEQRWRVLLYLVSAYLIGVNLFQIYQYNRTILHYNDMNRVYYQHIYLDPQPEPIEMSLLDTKEWIGNERDYEQRVLVADTKQQEIRFGAGGVREIANVALPARKGKQLMWLKVQLRFALPFSHWTSAVVAKISGIDSVKEQPIRLNNPVGNELGVYAFYMQVPEGNSEQRLQLELRSDFDFAGVVREINVLILEPKQ